MEVCLSQSKHGTDKDLEGHKARYARLLAGAERDPEVKCALALMVIKGEGVEACPSRAFTLYQEAADCGSLSALYNLGCMHLNGTAGKRDFDAAFDLFVRAASLGDGDAMFNLGYMHDRGLGRVCNQFEAFVWYSRAAEAGVGRAQYDLAAVYQHGRGVDIDLEKAKYWYGRAAKSGLARAVRNLEELESLDE